jgi:hypothetical protein
MIKEIQSDRLTGSWIKFFNIKIKEMIAEKKTEERNEDKKKDHRCKLNNARQKQWKTN